VKSHDAITILCRKELTMTYTKNQKAFLVLRLFLGVLFTTAGLGKFRMGIGTVAGHIVQGFEKTFLPKILLVPYAYCLPFVELIVGILLVLGLFTEGTLFVSAFLCLSLFYGMLLSGEHATAAYNAIYLLINVCAIRWFEQVPLSIDAARRNPGSAARPS
jgi:thiosulfate dehydrogenase (quinone) large subunit